MPGTDRDVVIVGASLGGLRTAEELRKAGHTGTITLIGDEAHLPYDRPPLSKQILSGTWSIDAAFLRSAAELAERAITTRTSTRAVGFDLNPAATEKGPAGTLALASGETLDFDELVIATGARPRVLPAADLGGVLTLRTLDDVTALTRGLARRPRLAVIGGGFIGAEVAAAAAHAGLAVTLIEQSPAPLSRVLGPQVGHASAQIHEAHGVHVLTDVAVHGLEGADQVTGVRLADGRIVPAELVVVGIGAIPNDEWLRGSLLTLDNGIVCDSTGAAAPHVWAVGDVSRWRHDVFDDWIRVEHWTHATEQAHVVAHNITHPADQRRLTGVPFVWSDQHGVKIQIAGRPHAGARMVPVNGAPGEAGFTALYVEQDRVIGGVSFDNPRLLAKIRRLISTRPTPDQAMVALTS